MTAGAIVRLSKQREAIVGYLPVGYWAEGVLTASIIPGFPIEMDRNRRDAQFPEEIAPVEHCGVFTSSPVVEIDGELVTTQNSVWRVEVLVP